jgi:CBS domain containing-hemolysin-like protein
MLLLFVYLFIALIVSFICSIMEAVLLSTPVSYLMVKEGDGHRWATKFLSFKNYIDKPLSAILSLNTVAHTVGAAGVGAQSIEVFGNAYFGIVSAILTILILVFTEIIPKTIGAQYWKGLAKITAHTISVMIFVTYPLVVISSLITKIFSKSNDGQSTSREEISALASIGAEEGLFNDKEHKIIQNLLRLKNVKVSEIKTPRVVVSVANEDVTLNEFARNKDFVRFSRIPVFSGNDENITGYIFRHTVFEKLAENQPNLMLKDIRREILVVPYTKTILGVWEMMLSGKDHIALVVDEYGGMDGIVTMEDIIETLLGLEIVDEKDTVTDMQQFARERWKMKQEKYKVIDSLLDNSNK